MGNNPWYCVSDRTEYFGRMPYYAYLTFYNIIYNSDAKLVAVL